ncbi:HpaII family restriction endonuclease [Porphyromonas loveana]|uniref:HpaII family restriction endonuclease n=1 Tax=Porphyromonas loveana TaxID=1884669 RepID=UPI00359F1996
MSNETKIITAISDLWCDADFLHTINEMGIDVLQITSACMDKDGSDCVIKNTHSELSRMSMLMDTNASMLQTAISDESLPPVEGQDLKRITDLFYPIVEILQKEKEGVCSKRIEDKSIVILSSLSKVLFRIPATEFLEEVSKLFETINRGKSADFVLTAETFAIKIHCRPNKTESSDKTDIRIVLHDRRTKINSELGFSIKSQLGGDSTLLNASKTTNFTFKIVGANLSDEDIERINAINPKQNKVIKRFDAIRRHGGGLIFDGIDNQTFNDNLLLLDGDLPLIMASLLVEQLNTRKSMLHDLVDVLADKNPLKYNSRAYSFYVYKIKHLLTSTALGMMPGTFWNGRYDANGGYLVVKKDGDILCYHFYDRNRFEDYLFANAYLERASTTRHNYASIVKESDGSLSFKLNLQIRLQ